MKRCPSCGDDKPRAGFAVNRAEEDGLQTYCRSCMTMKHGEWRRSHTAHDNAYQRSYYASNAERRRIQAREHYHRARQNPERVARMRVLKLDAIHRRKASMGTPDRDTIAYMTVLIAGPCSYCGKPRCGGVDHVIPIRNGGPHHWNNLTGACPPCNKSKQTKGVVSFLAYRLRVAA